MASFAEQIERLTDRIRREQAREMKKVSPLHAPEHPLQRANRARATAITKLEESRMWLEESLRHNPNPA